MATKRGIKSDLSGLFSTMSRDLRLKTEGLPELVYDIFEEEAEQQAEDMREFILSRPSEKSGKEGRVETFAMFDAVGVKAQRHSTQLTIHVGYVDGPWREYYKYQDEGFIHNWSGKFIEGTHAMEDAYLRARVRIEEKLHLLGLKGSAF